MANSIYVTAAEPYSGKILVSLGIMGMLERRIHRVGFFRPVANPYALKGQDRTVVDRDVHLSRGCSVDDIINTVAITAIQAQGGNCGIQVGAQK